MGCGVAWQGSAWGGEGVGQCNGCSIMGEAGRGVHGAVHGEGQGSAWSRVGQGSVGHGVMRGGAGQNDASAGVGYRPPYAIPAAVHHASRCTPSRHQSH